MVLAAIAFTAPAAAQAQAHGLTESGIFIAANSGVTITTTNLIIHTALGTITCAKITLHYTVETNTDEHVALEPVNVGGVETTNATTENCTLHTGGPTGATHPIDVSNAGTDTVTFNTWGTGSAAWRWTTKITFTGGGSVTCTYSGSVALQATNGSSNVSMGKSVLAGGLCGNGEVAATGSMETSNGTALAADIKTT